MYVYVCMCVYVCVCVCMCVRTRNVYDASEMFMCPRYANGTFSCPWEFYIYPFEDTYVEVTQT